MQKKEIVEEKLAAQELRQKLKLSAEAANNNATDEIS